MCYAFSAMQPTAPANSVEIISRIYEAAEDPRVWSNVLSLLGNEFGSTVNVFVLNDRQSPLSEVVVSDGADPKWEQEYNDYYHSTNIVLQRLAPVMSPGQVISSADAFRDTELLKSEYYQDFLRRRDVFYLMGGVVSATPTSNALLTLARSQRHGAWTSREKDSLAFFIPHLQRAARFSGNFARMRQERDEVLNRFAMGVIILNESGRIDFLNRSAEALLAKKDGLCRTSQGISAIDPSQSARLRTMILGARLTASRKGMGGGGSLSITRSSGSRPFSVLVAPLMPTSAAPLSQLPRVALFITDPDAVQPTNLERLTAIFDLTPAESKMADQLVQGKSVAEAAEELGVTTQTARVHLKRIFEKTGTGRQSELMRLLLNSPAALRD